MPRTSSSPPSPIQQRFSDAAVTALRGAIVDAGGNEVFFLGSVDEDRLVSSVRVLARGNRHAVPALLKVPRPGEVIIHNHPSGTLLPSDADLDVASNVGNNGVGTYIINNAVSDVYVVVEPHVDEARKPIQPHAAAAWLAPGGVLAKRLDHYEHRPQQLRMLEAVTTAFNQDAILTVEAGTGTGKSLAYLLPAIAWSLLNGERVVVSTHTINLQEQLIRKDLPLLTQLKDMQCTTALVKGRGNYLCKRKAEQVEEQGAYLVEDEHTRELKELLAWSKKTKDGSLGDLPVRPRPEVWEQVISENDNCLRARCPHYSTCFFYSARRAAAKADIIVVNHHLLMADLALRDELGSYTQNAVLPPSRRVIVDEAHHLEDVATSYFGSRLSFIAIERTLGRLRSHRSDSKGVFPALLMLLDLVERPEDLPIAQAASHYIEGRLIEQKRSLLTEAEQCFAELLIDLENQLGRTVREGADEKVRVVPAFRETPYWAKLQTWLRKLGTLLGQYAQEIAQVLESLSHLSEEYEKKALSLTTELSSLQGRIADYAAELLHFLGDDENTCRWIELRHRSRGGRSIVFYTAPIEVGPLLRKALFEQFPTVILTSATLAVDRHFDYVHEHLGLKELGTPHRLHTLHVDSPFDFAEQAVLAVPQDLPEPTDPRYEASTHEAILEIVTAAGGGTFVLFTAYGALNRAVSTLGPELQRRGIHILRQGEMNRHLLLSRFVADPRAVLFATDSFWEGVDVRGDALRCVIITRLPFRVPSEPIEQARVEAIEERGGNAFAEHTVPQAVIKLKQGFGRLIRSSTDRGAVVLLDSRVVHKHYGRVFLDSLPPAKRLIADRQRVYAALTRFFAERA